jgi:methanogenic corrinoid protein MtbC1
MVTDLMEMNGWDSHYLGPNTPLIGIRELAREKKADVVMISASSPAYVNSLRMIADSIHAESKGGVKVVVGGLYFNLDPAITRSFPADGYAANAIEAVKVTNTLVGIE